MGVVVPDKESEDVVSFLKTQRCPRNIIDSITKGMTREDERWKVVAGRTSKLAGIR